MGVVPVRKCVSAARASALVGLALAALVLLHSWRKISVSDSTLPANPTDSDLEKQVLADEAKQVWGLGEGGVAARLAPADIAAGADSERRLAINVFLSDRIPYNRTLNEHRDSACTRIRYPAILPSASVVVVFHNEPYSVLVRTIWSVLLSARRDHDFYRTRPGEPALGYPGQEPNSTYVYLKEIVLVDDSSTLDELGAKLGYYLRTRLPAIVRLLRLPRRRGLMFARSAGARMARGSVLVFLDAHCEAGVDWLRPLLARVAVTHTAVATPVIDVIDQTTFRLDAADDFQVGGFTFAGHFTWEGVSSRERRRRVTATNPTWSPTMAGGLFAIRRTYFWDLGGYDELMVGWGGENLEMSFRVWQCGGTLEVVPCSRVGHVFRSFHPYALPAPDSHGANTARAATVWMDDYVELFYLYRPDLRENGAVGDVTHRQVLRDKLHCKSFRWYLENIYPEKFVPVRDANGYGHVRNPSSGLCLDSLGGEGAAPPLGLFPCQGGAGRPPPTQLYYLSLAGELRDEERCAEVQYSRNGEDAAGRRVLMLPCHGKERGQRWLQLRGGRLQHLESRLCLDARGAATKAGSEVRARPCRSASDPQQQWIVDYTKENNYTLPGEDTGSERYKRLAAIRQHRTLRPHGT